VYRGTHLYLGVPFQVAAHRKLVIASNNIAITGVTLEQIGMETEQVTAQRASILFADHLQQIYRRTDRMFAALMLFQWIAAIAAALWLSPRTWAGSTSQMHIHVWAALFLGGAITVFPVFMACVHPGKTFTRHTIAAGQLLMSALLIHLTGGRIETHFHVFGSLAFLAFYRDWRVIVTGTVLTAVDHILRGIFWPQSAYGVQFTENWRWLEHAGWVIFEDTFLIISCQWGLRELGGICERDARLESSNLELERSSQSLRYSEEKLRLYNENLEETVRERTRQIEHQAFHDSLTELPNRALFLDRLLLAQARAKRSRSPIAVIFIDLDNFKVVNDTLGHEAGDQLLKAVAERLAKCVRPGETVARLGGDEFTILLEEVQTEADVVRVTERLMEALRHPILLNEQEIFASASIGVAFQEVASDAADALLRNADTPMYEAKTNGKSSYVLFEPSMNDHVVERLEIETGLRTALERGELYLNYQPLISLDSSQMIGVEALLRWNHPAKGLIPPGKFISIAEDTGLIVPIGYWVLEEACRQMMVWKDQHPDFGTFTMNVNLSGKQLMRTDVVERVQRAIMKTGIDPANLKLEITESVMMTDMTTTIDHLNRLKALGVKLAMDDFGTGYSSMANMNAFPLDTIKIDRAFIQRLANEDETGHVVEAIIALSKALHLDVTGEGVETLQQAARLKDLGCDIAQGYYFARPLTPEAMNKLMVEGPQSLFTEDDLLQKEIQEPLPRAA
jgi:diguanylate cyclase (GGDEF)-like protein